MGKQKQAFLEELLALFQKHKMAVVPKNSGEYSLHDPLHVVPLNKVVQEYLERIH